jgi:hypothetical protein
MCAKINLGEISRWRGWFNRRRYCKPRGVPRRCWKASEPIARKIPRMKNMEYLFYKP